MNLPAHRGLQCVARKAAATGAQDVTDGQPAEPAARSRCRPKHDLAGHTNTRIILEFARWAFERETFPTVDDIVQRFNVSKATAYRWRNELGQACRMSELPPNDASRCTRATHAAMGWRGARG